MLINPDEDTSQDAIITSENLKGDDIEQELAKKARAIGPMQAKAE